MQEVDVNLVQRCAREGTLVLDSIEAVGTYIPPRCEGPELTT